MSLTSFKDLKLSKYQDNKEDITTSYKATTERLSQGTLDQLENTVRAPKIEIIDNLNARQEAMEEARQETSTNMNFRKSRKGYRFLAHHPVNNIILDINLGVRTTSYLRNSVFSLYLFFLWNLRSLLKVLQTLIGP